MYKISPLLLGTIDLSGVKFVKVKGRVCLKLILGYRTF